MNCTTRDHLLLVLCSFFCLLSAILYAGEVEGFNPVIPRRLGMGSAGLTTVWGTETLWINPSALASSRPEFNLVSLAMTGYGSIDGLASAFPYAGDVGAMIRAMGHDIVTGGGALNVATGLGWTGKGWGLAFFTDIDLFAEGTSLPDTTHGYFDATLAVPLGFGWKLPLDSSIDFSVGLALRPSLKYRIDAGPDLIRLFLEEPETAAKITDTSLSHPTWGIPVDIGLLSEFQNGFKAALVARNLLASYYGQSRSADRYVHWGLDAGIGWKPLGSRFRSVVEPSFAVDLRNINRIISDKWTILEETAFGMELAFFRRLATVQAGFHNGSPSLGIRLDLLIVELSAAWTTTDLSKRDNGRKVQTIGFEFALRIN